MWWIYFNLTNLYVDLLQTKFGARCRAWNVAQFNQDQPPTIRLRLDDELKVPDITDDFIVKDKKEVLGWDTFFLFFVRSIIGIDC